MSGFALTPADTAATTPTTGPRAADGTGSRRGFIVWIRPNDEDRALNAARRRAAGRSRASPASRRGPLARRLASTPEREGETHRPRIDELEPKDVADRLRTECALGDRLAWRTEERDGRARAKRCERRRRTEPKP